MQVSMTMAHMERSAGVLVGQACGEAWVLALRRAERHGSLLADSGLAVPTLTVWGRGTNISAKISEVTSNGADLTRPAPRAQMAKRVRVFRRHHHGGPFQNMALETVGLGGLTGLGDLESQSPAGRTRTAKSVRIIAGELLGDVAARDACVLWAEAVRVAVQDGRFDVAGGLALIPTERRDQWRDVIEEAEGADPSRFASRTSPVREVQTAWAAITSTPVPSDDVGDAGYACEHLQDALRAAAEASFAAGPETGITVAALAGCLLGARWGLSAVPVEWLRHLRGLSGLRARDLVRFGVLTARRGQPTPKGWPSQPHIVPKDWVSPPAVHLPRLPALWMGGIGSSGHNADAVVTLCVLGSHDVPAKGVDPENHIEPWLVSSIDPADNPNHDFALDQAVKAIQTLLNEGHQVLVHCTRSVHRTPQVVTRLLAQQGVEYDVARREVLQTLAEAGYERPTENWVIRRRSTRNAETSRMR